MLKTKWDSIIDKDGLLKQLFFTIPEEDIALAREHGFRTIRLSEGPESTFYAVWPGKIEFDTVLPTRIAPCKDPSEIKGARIERSIEHDYGSLSAFLTFAAGVPASITIEGDTDAKKGTIVVNVCGLGETYEAYMAFVELLRRVRIQVMSGMGAKKGKDVVIDETARAKTCRKSQSYCRSSGYLTHPSQEGQLSPTENDRAGTTPLESHQSET